MLKIDKKFSISVISVATTLSCITACSSGYSYRRPESIDEKINRYQSRNQNGNQVPNINVGDYKFDRHHKRGPASVSTRASQKDEGLNQYNNKRLYFLTLLSQYQEFSKYSTSDSAQAINHCPNFHTSYLNYKDANSMDVTKVSYKVPFPDLSLLEDDSKVANFPEFFLPMSSTSTQPRVIDILRNSKKSSQEVLASIQEAINIHVKKTSSEIRELCDTGSSANYYTYENLITYIKTKKKLGPNKEGMQILYKTTLFSNMAIEKSFKKYQKEKSRGIASFAKKASYDNEVIKRLEVPWAIEYFK
ncbi:hypothetical protein [Halobacteriovorax sp. HLS]|uniref:hypothetical protein n=1 Tax=Halobacteriovorax sp. HLS TaxID=2234000 RepID=UPI000FDA3857|nr:hypothetical protein [Halobacteriovorax sp. HLS]